MRGKKQAAYINKRLSQGFGLSSTRHIPQDIYLGITNFEKLLTMPGQLELSLSEEEFYQTNPLRRLSRELDYGVFWRLPGQKTHTQLRMTWVHATGEFYLSWRALDGNDHILVFTQVEPKAEEKVEKALDGWAEHCNTPNGLLWLMETLTPLADKHQTTLEQSSIVKKSPIQRASAWPKPRGMKK